MHYCPNCGQACFCHGDIDDVVVETPEYSDRNCVCDCDEDDWDDRYYDEE